MVEKRAKEGSGVNDMVRRTMKHSKKQDKNKQKVDFSIAVFQALDKNIEKLRGRVGDPNDLAIRHFSVRETEHKCAIAYIGGLVNEEIGHQNIMKNVQLVTERKQLP